MVSAALFVFGFMHIEIVPCMLWNTVLIKIGHFSLLFSANKNEGLEMSHTNWGQF